MPVANNNNLRLKDTVAKAHNPAITLGIARMVTDAARSQANADRFIGQQIGNGIANIGVRIQRDRETKENRREARANREDQQAHQREMQATARANRKADMMDPEVAAFQLKNAETTARMRHDFTVAEIKARGAEQVRVHKETESDDAYRTAVALGAVADPAAGEAETAAQQAQVDAGRAAQTAAKAKGQVEKGKQAMEVAGTAPREAPNTAEEFATRVTEAHQLSAKWSERVATLTAIARSKGSFRGKDGLARATANAIALKEAQTQARIWDANLQGLRIQHENWRDERDNTQRIAAEERSTDRRVDTEVRRELKRRAETATKQRNWYVRQATDGVNALRANANTRELFEVYTPEQVMQMITQQTGPEGDPMVVAKQWLENGAQKVKRDIQVMDEQRRKVEGLAKEIRKGETQFEDLSEPDAVELLFSGELGAGMRTSMRSPQGRAELLDTVKAMGLGPQIASRARAEVTDGLRQWQANYAKANGGDRPSKAEIKAKGDELSSQVSRKIGISDVEWKAWAGSKDVDAGKSAAQRRRSRQERKRGLGAERRKLQEGFWGSTNGNGRNDKRAQEAERKAAAKFDITDGREWAEVKELAEKAGLTVERWAKENPDRLKAYQQQAKNRNIKIAPRR